MRASEITIGDNNVMGYMAKNLTGLGSPIAKIRHKRDTEREKLGSISYGYKQDPNLKTTHKQVPFSEDGVTEAGVGPAFRESVAHLKALGYEHIGSGADARVWAKDTSHVIKILMPDKPGNHAEITFRKFYRFCELHPEISCLPIFNDVNTIELAGEDYTQIDMERLIPIEKGSVRQAMIWILSDYATTGETWQQILPSLTDPETWSFFTNSQASVMARIINDEMTTRGVTFYKTYATLFRIMKVLYQLYPKQWDLHTENVMQRANGELVIIDPWFSDGLKSL